MINDATSIAEIWPKLTPEQKQWIKSLDKSEREETEEILKFKGEAYFLETFGFLRDQLEYVRSL